MSVHIWTVFLSSSPTASALTATRPAACIDACKATHSLKEDAGLLVPKAQTGPFENVLLYSTSYGLFSFRDNKSVGCPGFKHINEFAEIFHTSRTATCIRLAQIDTLPIIAACYRGNDLRWLSRAPDVPRK